MNLIFVSHPEAKIRDLVKTKRPCYAFLISGECVDVLEGSRAECANDILHWGEIKALPNNWELKRLEINSDGELEY